MVHGYDIHGTRVSFDDTRVWFYGTRVLFSWN